MSIYDAAWAATTNRTRAVTSNRVSRTVSASLVLRAEMTTGDIAMEIIEEKTFSATLGVRTHVTFSILDNTLEGLL